MRSALTLLICISYSFIALAQVEISGLINDSLTGNAIPYANILAGDGAGAAADEQGQFQLSSRALNYPVTLKFSRIGYTTKSIVVKESVDNLSVVLSPKSDMLNSLVVTGTRTLRTQLENPVSVNVLSRKSFNVTGSSFLSDGLCFQPGLRMETDCQTCGYSQLRMNGLPGSYSQILVNGRPVFSSLQGLYGLEQIPTNMIERVEVVRGGGSVLYGSSAIGGTVNIITREPRKSSYQLNWDQTFTNNERPDQNLQGNVNVVNEERTAGLSAYFSHRDRAWFDANGDGYSEIPQIKSNAFGLNAFYKITDKTKLSVKGWSINENRRGGNKFHLPAHKADQSEDRIHNILLGGIDLDHQFSKDHWVTAYFAGQVTDRLHYTGLDQSDGWGTTDNHTWQGGLQWNRRTDWPLEQHTLTIGTEVKSEYIRDEIPAYDYLIDQQSTLAGLFAQSDWELNNYFTLLTGLRIDHHNLVNKLIYNPRVNLLGSFLEDNLQLRLSYAKGFKAPRAFDTDLHIAFAGGGISFVQLDDNLKEEISHSYNGSLSYDLPKEKYILGFTINAFHTRLLNAFALQNNGTDANGNLILLKKNARAATVKGITLDMRANYDGKVQFESGFTFQESAFDNPINWSDNQPGESQFLRQPDMYGYWTATVLPESRFNLMLSGVATGPMEVPHLAGAIGVESDELVTTPWFHQVNVKAAYSFPLKGLDQQITLAAGMKNIFNDYQDDFDRGRYRDSNYVYGPALPRSVFFSLTVGSL